MKRLKEIFGRRGMSWDGENLREMRSKLIIWDGRPFLSLSAVDTTATVRWSAMLDASPGKVPPNVERALDELAVQFPPADGAGRVAKGR